MPPEPSFPGVFVEEPPSAVRTIAGVPTSIAAFVGPAWRGPVDTPIHVSSFAEFERTFGGLSRGSPMSYAVQQFFSNGGGQAVVVRVVTRSDTPADQAKTATFAIEDTTFAAASPGSWGMDLVISADTNTNDTTDPSLFNLTVLDDPNTRMDAAGMGGSGAREEFLDVSVDPLSPRYVVTVLAQQSNLVRCTAVGATPPGGKTPVAAMLDADSGADGIAVTDADVANPTLDANNAGLYALRTADIFNLLVIPPFPSGTDVSMATWTAAANLAKERRAVVLVNSPSDWTIRPGLNFAGTRVADFGAIERSSAALYFPRIRVADPLEDGNPTDFAPSAAVAGLIARTDAERGVWKAPAGTEAKLLGVQGLSCGSSPATLTDADTGNLNPAGINVLRTLPGTGIVVWGARTLEGSDALASEWKYLPVRRLALYIEESLYRGTKWAVFEPNDEPLWSQIRLNVGAFMENLFRQGAFQGATPREAYFVKCGTETTTEDDINRGVVNILVGFAPIKPAEFVVLRIQQLAGQTRS